VLQLGIELTGELEHVIDVPAAESLVVVYFIGAWAETNRTESPLLKLPAYVDELYPEGNAP
jgi:hypothetical protein